MAYLIPAELSPPFSELRRYLQEQVPEYMVPHAFVLLDTLPLTPNGKVDRHALPAPDTTRPDLDKAYVAPRTPVEQLLAEIWRHVLGLEQVGIHDNFFELGGIPSHRRELTVLFQYSIPSCSVLCDEERSRDAALQPGAYLRFLMEPPSRATTYKPL